jgi:hypothetical protein
MVTLMKMFGSGACSAAAGAEFVSTTPPATADLQEAIHYFQVYYPAQSLPN